MAKITTKQELIAYFTDKSQRAHEGDAYVEAATAVLKLLNETDDIVKIKAAVRGMHREKLAEIQRTEDVETRIVQRKQLGIYDECLTQLRGIAIS